QCLGLAVNVHRTLSLDKNVDLFLVRMIVGRPGTLVRPEKSIARYQLVSSLADVEHQVDVLALQAPDSRLLARDFSEARMMSWMRLRCWSRALEQSRFHRPPISQDHLGGARNIECIVRL